MIKMQGQSAQGEGNICAICGLEVKVAPRVLLCCVVEVLQSIFPVSSISGSLSEERVCHRKERKETLAVQIALKLRLCGSLVDPSHSLSISFSLLSFTVFRLSFCE